MFFGLERSTLLGARAFGGCCGSATNTPQTQALLAFSRFFAARSLSPNKKSLSPNKKSLSPSKKSLSPNKKSLSPNKKSLSPNKKSLSPSKKSLSPNKKSLSPFYRGTNREIGRGFAMFLPLTPLPSRLRSVASRGEGGEEGGCSKTMHTSPCRVAATALLCEGLCSFPLALQRGFASVAGRGDARRAGVRVTRSVPLSEISC